MGEKALWVDIARSSVEPSENTAQEYHLYTVVLNASVKHLVVCAIRIPLVVKFYNEN